MTRGPVVDSPAFEVVCEALESLTKMTRSEARGTVRITLKQIGLDPTHVTRSEIAATLMTALPGVLEACRIEDAQQVCAEIARSLLASSSASPSPEATAPESAAVPEGD